MMKSRREFLKKVGLGLAAALAPGASVRSIFAAGRAKPNIVLIMADDFGYECLRCNGGQSYDTPRLDEMTAKGLRFTNCHSQPVCTPSRVKIMTGKYNSRNYVAFETLSARETTFAHVLKAAGYRTCIAGKWQLSGRGKEYPGTSAVAAGFDEYCLWQMDEQTNGSRYWAPTIRQNGRLLAGLTDAYGPDVFCRFVCDFIEANRARPFFVYYPMALTHGPHVPTPDSRAGGKGAKRNTKYFPDMVAYADKIVGRILDKLHETGLAENTLVLFTGDNGTDKKVTSLWRNRQIRGGKGRTIDAGTHVPLIAYWKGVTPEAAVCEDLIDFSDFLPTLVDLGAAPVPAGLRHDGVSFLPQVQGRRGTPKDYIFCHYEKGKYPYEGQKTKTNQSGKSSQPKKGKLPYTRFVRDKRWKLYQDGRLFDVAADPEETAPIPAGTDGRADAVRCRFQAVLGRMGKQNETAGERLP